MQSDKAMNDPAAIQVIVYGRVQGVFFRAFVSRQTTELGLTGYVCNLRSGNAVEVYAEGKRNKLEKLIDYLKTGPPLARVEKLVTTWSEYSGNYSHFEIRY